MKTEDDPRFATAIGQLNAGDYFEAGDVFEELYFEAVRDEVEFVRVFLQIAVGAYHAECGQRRPAVERLGEGILAIDRVTNDRGFDLQQLRRDVVAFMADLSAGRAPGWPRVRRRDGPATQSEP